MSQIRRSLSWSLSGTAGRAASQFVFAIWLTREIGPDAVGTATIPILIVGLGALFADGGLSAGLITTGELTARLYQRTFTLQFVIGIAIAALVSAASPILASIFLRGHYAVLFILAGLTIPVQASGSAAIGVLRRHHRQKSVQLLQICALGLGYCVPAASLVALNAGYWAIPLGLLCQALLQSILAVCIIEFRPALRSSRLGDVWRSSNGVLYAHMGNWAADNVDNIIVGLLRGPTSLAFYSRPYAIIRSPLDVVLTSTQQVLFPTFARRSSKELQSLFLRASEQIQNVTVPGLAIVAVLGPSGFKLLYGPQWYPAAQVTTPLAIAMMFHVYSAATGPLLWAINQAVREAKIQLCTSVLLILTLLFAARHSVVAAAWAVAACYAIRAVLAQLTVANILEIRLVACCRAAAWPAVMAASVAALALATKAALEHITHVTNNWVLTLLPAAISGAVLAVWVLLHLRAASPTYADSLEPRSSDV